MDLRIMKRFFTACNDSL